MQKSTLIASIIALLVFSTSALAHSPVKETSPPDEAVLTSVPEMLHLTFAAPARVMKVTMTHTKAENVHETRIEIPTRDMVEEMHLTPEFMGAGTYLVQWRALGEDGHVLTGEFGFEVTGE